MLSSWEYSYPVFEDGIFVVVIIIIIIIIIINSHDGSDANKRWNRILHECHGIT